MKTTNGVGTEVIIGILAAIVVILSLAMALIVRKLFKEKSRNAVQSQQQSIVNKNAVAIDQEEGMQMTSNMAYGIISPQLSASSGNVTSMTTTSSSELKSTSSQCEIEHRVNSEVNDGYAHEYSYIPAIASDRALRRPAPLSQ